MSNKSSPMPKRTTDCRDKIADRYDASLKRDKVSHRQLPSVAECSDLVVWKAVQAPTHLTNMVFDDEVFIASTRGSGHYVLIKWERYEYDYREEIDYSAYSPHSLRTVSKELAP